MKTGSLQSYWIRFSTAATTSSIVLFVVAIPVAVCADVRISEFVYDAPGSDDKHEWIEIFNAGRTPVDISRWKISDGSRHVLNAPPKNGSVGTTTLQPSTFAILVDNAMAFAALYPSVAVSIIDTSINLPNAGGTISLIDASGKVADSVSYLASAGAAGNGNSLQKSVSEKWLEAKPTPGTANAEVAAPVEIKSTTPPPKKSAAAKRTTPKTTTKRPAAAQNAAKRDVVLASPIGETVVDSAEVAAVGSPTKSLVSPWLFGTLGIAGVAAVAGIAAMRSKKEEWEIVEETD